MRSEVLRELQDVAEFRIEVSTQRELPKVTITVEPRDSTTAPDVLAARVREHIKARLNFTVDVTIVPPGTLPRFEMKGRRFFRAAPPS